MICDHNGNVLMTNEQYGLYDFFETDDGALLACVYNTDADGNKKFGAVKLHVEDTPQPAGRNGLVFDADGGKLPTEQQTLHIQDLHITIMAGGI